VKNYNGTCISNVTDAAYSSSLQITPGCMVKLNKTINEEGEEEDRGRNEKSYGINAAHYMSFI
jgi:hypothetical protein